MPEWIWDDDFAADDPDFDAAIRSKHEQHLAYTRMFFEEHGDCECLCYHRKPRCNKRMCKDNPHLNFYCPQCHEVACGMKRQGGWIVLPHYKEDVQGHLAKGSGRLFGLPCRGGNVDYDKDRAP